jgi:hypothetical protein
MSEIDVAACVISNTEAPPHPAPTESCASTVNLGAEAQVEAQRIAAIRRLPACESVLPEHIVPVTLIRSRDTSLIALFRMRLVTRAGRLVEDTLVPVRVGIDVPTPLRRRIVGRGSAFTRKATRSLAESLLSVFGAALLSCARTHGEQRAHAISSDAADSIVRAITRERAITALAAARSESLVQAGLFDTRSLKVKRAREQHRETIRGDSEARASLLEGDASIGLAGDPELVMLLISWSRA